MTRTLVGVVAAASLAVATSAVAISQASNDSFIQGYAAAVLEREFGIRADAVTVQDGVVTVEGDLAVSERERLSAILEEIEGVQDVEIIEGDTRAEGSSWLPGRALFQPLLADPRWPHFAAAYHYYVGDAELTNVGAVSFGESWALWRYGFRSGASVEWGLHAGVFAIFDLDADSSDLVNADYLVGLPFTYAKGDFSAMARYFHQSSHLGDEFLLRSRVERINLSYEAIDLLLSHELPWGLRVYGGGGYIARVEPADIDPWSTQAGLEYIGSEVTLRIGMKPVVALDAQHREESDWATNLSVRSGLRFGPRGSGRNLQLLLEYFNGRSPNGQFYERHIEYLGIGGHLYF